MRKRNLNGVIYDHLEQNEFMKFVFDHSSDLFWILDENKKTKYISTSVADFLGYSVEEYLQLSIENKITNYSLKVLNELFDYPTENKYFNNIRIDYINKYGLIVNTIVNGKIVKDEFGRFKGIYGISKNISNELRLQDELNLEKYKNNEAEKFKNSIIGTLGHEFRTPLSGIIGFAGLLSKKLKDESHEMISYILESANRLNFSINTLLTLIAIETNQLEIKYDKVEIDEIIHSLFAAFEAKNESKKLDFKITNNTDLNDILIDENCLYQILFNLLDNAFKFTECGFIHIRFDIQKIYAINHLIIRVQDSGIGISSNMFDLIFEPFRQISEGNDRKFEGLGIGLSTTRKLIEKLSGTINLNSDLNNGSTFIVKLPLK